MLNIKLIRQQKGLTIRELAEQTGISKSTLSDLENNKRIPKDQELKIISQVLGVKEEDLWRSGNR